ncbi:hypothetical protein, partial [Methylobacterium longum]|uniref:hypothetical protein n=1 Tax=Methylobacterium longum TaxID=767694 RepID=UPI001EE343F1
MLRFFSIVSAAGAVALMLGEPASAGSTIAVATIAAGRLYVLGTTERPHTPVILDGQFRTESDDWGGFQYDLVYHPAPCIVSATIQGKAYKAVVSDCGQQGSPGPSRGSGEAMAVPSPGAKPAAPITSGRTSATASIEPPNSTTISGTVGSTPSSAPTPIVPVPDTTSAVNGKARL